MSANFGSLLVWPSFTKKNIISGNFSPSEVFKNKTMCLFYDFLLVISLYLSINLIFCLAILTSTMKILLEFHLKNNEKYLSSRQMKIKMIFILKQTSHGNSSKSLHK